jgi:hypothetical protein
MTEYFPDSDRQKLSEALKHSPLTTPFYVREIDPKFTEKMLEIQKNKISYEEPRTDYYDPFQNAKEKLNYFDMVLKNTCSTIQTCIVQQLSTVYIHQHSTNPLSRTRLIWNASSLIWNLTLKQEEPIVQNRVKLSLKGIMIWNYRFTKIRRCASQSYYDRKQQV